MSLRDKWIPLMLVFISAGAELMGGLSESWRYDRDGILAGQLWRMLTGHFVHGTLRHWVLNMAGLLLIWAIYPGYFRQLSALPLIVGIACLVSSAFFILNPEVSWYLGMSALLHGLFAAWSLADLLGGRRIAAIPLALVVLKVLYEQYAGAAPEIAAAIGIPVLVDAHLYGVIAGLSLGAGMYKLGNL